MTKQPHGQLMTLGDMRELGVRRLIAFCHNDACRHGALIDVSVYPGKTAVPWFQLLAHCRQCGRPPRQPVKFMFVLCAVSR